MVWRQKPQPNPGAVQLLASTVTKDPLLAQLLVARGIDSFDAAKSFFRPSLNHLHDPYRMKDMERAVERIEKARLQQEHVMIYGDYDVDGTTSVALMCDFLEGKFPIEAYIPDRYKEGYGLSFDGINLAAELGVTLLIALDCGIKAFDQIAHAKSLGIDIIVCDHHRPEEELPKAHAILDPKRPDCLYPYKELSACGVGFKLCQALCERWGLPHEPYLYPLLDLCAVSIAADIVHVTGENRVLAHFGLERLRTSQCRTGFLSLLEAAKKRPETLSFKDIGFSIGPRINAAGRMESGLRAVELLRSKDKEEQDQLANAINDFNTDRRSAQAEIFEEAKALLDAAAFPNSTVLYAPHWHKGVVGIVASKMVEHYYRPTIILTKSGEVLAGSARSVLDFDVYDALEACESHLLQFGGHKYAAGLTLRPENYTNFKDKFEEVVERTIDTKLLTPEISVDAAIDFSEITPKFFRIIQQMAPFGPLNMKPVFSSISVRDNGYGKQVGANKAHLKLNLFQGDNKKTFNAIGFNLGTKMEFVQNDFDVAYALDENEWNGHKNLQLVLKDIK